jgi:hypothetical protein
LSWSSAICEKYATGAVQMEGAILVVAVMMVLRFKHVNILFQLKRLAFHILSFILIIRFNVRV